jgi:hypothetical protein
MTKTDKQGFDLRKTSLIQAVEEVDQPGDVAVEVVALHVRSTQ